MHAPASAPLTVPTPAPRPEALPAGPFYHGGKRGLGPGDWLVPSPPHKADGCPICVARAEGRSFTVGEMRAWAAGIGGRQAERLLAQLEGADDAESIDPPTGQQAVYITSDRDYAAWYAARSEGDLYRVTPVGAVTASPEDHFPTWTCVRARVLEVVRRKVRLRDRERRRLLSRWKDADSAALAAVERAS